MRSLTWSRGKILANRPNYPTDEASDLYDQNLLTDRKCPKCGKLIISCPDCTEVCSNDECDYELG